VVELEVAWLIIHATRIQEEFMLSAALHRVAIFPTLALM
jgi:hypothetical protein